MILLNRRKYFHRRRPQGAPADLADAVVTLASETVYYTGNPVYPSVSVTYEGATLIVNTDYTLNYTDNTNVGAATVTVTGMGEYTGSVVKTFQIVSAAPGVWDFKVEDMEYVGYASTGATQGGFFFGVAEDYSSANALFVGKAFLNGRFALGQLITKDSQQKIHVENLDSNFEKTSSGSGVYMHLMLISDDGKTTFWRSNSLNENYIKATCSSAFDFQNLSFDTSNVMTFDSLHTIPGCMVFADEGTRLFYASGVDGQRRRVYSAPLTTAYDLSSYVESSADYVEITEVPQSTFVTIYSVLFNEGGTVLIITAAKVIYQFSLSTPYDLSTRTLESQKTLDYEFRGIAVINDGKTLLGMTSGGKLYEYNLTA